VAALPPEERERRCAIDDEAVILDGQWFFVRANLEIPVRGRERPWVLTVWGSLSAARFHEMIERWRDPRRTEMEPCFSWLCNGLACFPTTEPIAARMHVREVGVRPFYEVEPTDHPLAVAQREGLELHEAVALAQRMTRGA
jgi:hypothetical protein